MASINQTKEEQASVSPPVLGIQHFLEEQELEPEKFKLPLSAGGSSVLKLLQFLGESPNETFGHVMDQLRLDFEQIVERLDNQGMIALLRECQCCLIYPQLRYIPEILIFKLNKLPSDVLQFIAEIKLEEVSEPCWRGLIFFFFFFSNFIFYISLRAWDLKLRPKYMSIARRDLERALSNTVRLFLNIQETQRRE
jgi:hypothetical protein